MGEGDEGSQPVQEYKTSGRGDHSLNPLIFASPLSFASAVKNKNHNNCYNCSVADKSCCYIVDQAARCRRRKN